MYIRTLYLILIFVITNCSNRKLGSSYSQLCVSIRNTQGLHCITMFHDKTTRVPYTQFLSVVGRPHRTKILCHLSLLFCLEDTTFSLLQFPSFVCLCPQTSQMRGEMTSSDGCCEGRKASRPYSVELLMSVNRITIVKHLVAHDIATASQVIPNRHYFT